MFSPTVISSIPEKTVIYSAVTAYKWMCALFGISFGYVSRRVLDKIRPTYVGWTGNKDRHNHSRYKLDLYDGANRFETGSLNWVGLKGLEQSARLYLPLGSEDVEGYILHLTDYLYQRVAELRDVGLVGPFPEKKRSGIAFLTVPAKWELTDTVMREKGLRVDAASESTIRVALHYYNNTDDIDRLIEFLKSLQDAN